MSEIKVLESWKLKVGLLIAVVAPTVTITAFIFGLKADLIARVNATETKTTQRIAEVELKTEQNKADKSALEALTNEVKGARSDIIEIKTLLKRR